MSILAYKQHKQHKQHSILSGIVLFMLSAVSSVQAQYTWVGTTGDINTASNWSPSGVPSAGNTYTFGNTGITTTVTGNPAPGVLIVVNSSAGVKDYTISGVLSGATTVTKNGSSRLTLTGANTYSGITNVNAGILNIQNNTALGTTANGTVVASGARLQIQNNITVTGEALTINGDPTKVSAIGGRLTTTGAYAVRTFRANDNFIVINGGTVEYLVIGGGGGGGGGWSGSNWTGGGGGGAGGYRSSVSGEPSGGGASAESPLTLGVGNHAIVAGGGGTGGSVTNNGTNGFDSYIQNPSSVDLVRSIGGGGGAGARRFTRRNGLAGGSGGGAAGESSTGSTGGSGTTSQGYNGGLHGANRGSGGGGGAGGAGLNSGGPGFDGYNNYARTHGGTGGPGLFSSITGVSIQRGGGGGGGCDETANYLPGIGGLGGGGTGGTPTSTVGTSGTANTGGGGGGGTQSAGGNGGSGVVILRYLAQGALENVSGVNTWTGAITLASNSTILTSTGTLNISGTIGGSYSLTKTGAGTLTLTQANTFTGGTTLSEGTLNINNASALGSVAGNFTIEEGTQIDNTSGGTLTTASYPQLWIGDFAFTGTQDLNLGTGAVTMTASRQVTTTTSGRTLTVGGIISGAGFRLTKAGAGNLSLAGANTFTGGVTLNAGVLNINNTQALGTVAGTFIINGGTIDNTTGAAITTLNYPQAWNGDFSFTGTQDLNMGTGAVAMTASRQITTTTAGRTLTVGGIISGAGSRLTKAGAGTLTLTSANIFTGGVTLDAGVLNINNTQALGTAAGTFIINGGAIDNTTGAAITTLNYPQAWNGDFAFTGTNNLNLGTGSVTMSASRQVTTTANILTIGGVINDNTRSLTKAGAGTLAFVGQAVTLDALTISAGTLTSTSGNLDLSGNFTNNSAFTHNSGRVRFVGSSASTLSSSATTAFHNLTINNPGGVTMTGGTFQVSNNMTFTNGVVDQNATLVILNGATATGASNLSHVNGTVRKTGNQAFTFPVGKNGFYRPISISAPSVNTDQFSAEYFNTPQSFGFTYLAPLNHVSGCEYWNLDRMAGSSNVSVTLTWNQAACSIYAITMIPNLKVGYWNSSNWVDMGATSIIGNSTAGSLTSLAPVTQFGTFTLATNTALNVLPIQLTSFNAENKGAFVDVKWATSSEQNCDFFTVERSTDNVSFESIGTVKGHGTTQLANTYVLIDKNIAGLTKAYYRLKQTDLDGRTQYSKTIKLSFNQSMGDYSVYPVPNNGQFTIRGNLQKVKQVYLLNATGVLLRRLPLQAQQSIGDLTPGMYILQLVGDNFTEHIKYIKY